MVRTRFAPSPTGFLHIGGARTGLFAWLYARKNKGQFVLRIEDTDQVRSKKEYLDEILASLSWMGLDWDEIYYQSQRFDIYREAAQRLIKEGKAEKKEGAVFFKYDFEKVEWNDLIRGRISFSELPKQEEVIIKSDGSPTYNFCCVIDDALMKISHVIRGEDHISNTPKQILIYQGLGFDVPQFAHVPMILAEQGGKMSKRFGATAISEYKAMGYLPEALVNYLLLLGWAPGNNRELITLSEAKDIFEIRDVNKTAAAFSGKKLNWVNSEYLKSKTIPELSAAIKEFLPADSKTCDNITEEYFSRVVRLFQGRMNTLAEFKDWSGFCFTDQYEYDEDTSKILDRDLSREISLLSERMEKIGNYSHDEIEGEFRAVAQDLGLKARDLVHPVRVALTGKRIGPGLFELMEVLGKEKVKQRLQRLISFWQK